MKHLIGHTPMVSLPHPSANILAKLEWLNPFGSVKDRAVTAMLDAMAPQPGQTVVEATSGNTGIALAALAAARGCRCIIVMPENMSLERMTLMKFYGAQVILTPAHEGMAGSVRLAQYLARDCGGLYLNQFENPANAAAHYQTTGPEIWEGCNGNVDIFIAGIGTGGTITGAGRYLREQNRDIRIVGVEPAPGQQIPGLGAGLTPAILDEAILSERICVSENNALWAAKKSGLGCGISAGGALFAAHSLAQRPENRGKTIVTILPDSITRYLSTLG